MAIEELVAVVPPPAHPRQTGDMSAWQAMQKRFGISLPTDYRDLAMTYGSGKFIGWGPLIQVLNPLAPDYDAWLADLCETLWLCWGCYEDCWPYRPHPHRPGLLPWGSDDNGTMLLWLTQGEPDPWPVICHPHEGFNFERFDLSMTTFLAEAFSGQLDCSFWPMDFFTELPKVKFVQNDCEIEWP